MNMAAKPRVVLLRGHHANVWDLRPWERLQADFDVSVLVTGSNLHQVSGLEVEVVPVRTPRDALPAGRAAGAVAYALGERYLRLEPLLVGADIVHAAELSTWFAAQAARLRSRLGFKLALTVWETIPWRDTYRWPRERGYRRAVLGSADRFLPATDRARGTLRLEGVSPELIELCPPGIDLEPFASARGSSAPGRPELLSAGRLVWEKGHQDVLRALAALRGGLAGLVAPDMGLTIVGSGPEEGKLRAYASELGLDDAVTFKPTVPYAEMPALYAGATALVLASLPTRTWEEQFGMVLIEALAAGTPVIAAASGAIPEVLGGDGRLFEPGDWLGLARVLAEGPLASGRAFAGTPDLARLERYSVDAAAQRYRDVYAGLLA
jgi:glycosyltransferase involved in cell wall biosynthesis